MNGIFRKLPIVALFLLFSASMMAQVVLRGTVRDEDNLPLPGVSLQIKESKAGTVTDGNGDYSFRLMPGKYTLNCSYTGFEAQSLAVDVATIDTRVDVRMVSGSGQLGEVVISVGSRASQRTITDSPLPIDVLGVKDLKATGQMTFDKALQYRVPSFNTVNTPVNDATSLLDPYEIRNMGPSRTLILINGKRKNLSALMYLQTSPGRGESGADISAIPQDAIKRVEILRDGASAQYGSDAIAGVMNVILKDRHEYGSVNLRGGVTSEGDGEQFGVSINNGINYGEKGYLNYTADFSRFGQANRPGTVSAEGEAADFGAALSDVQAFLSKYPDARNINGQPETTASKFLINGGIPVGKDMELYANAAYVFKQVNSFANFRTPYWRTAGPQNPYSVLAAQNNLPYEGYVPTFEGNLNDYNGTVGVRSENNGWMTDASFTTGGNKQTYLVANSRNRSYGINSPLVFRPGGYIFSHNVGNIDMSRSVLDNLKVALGTEFRIEKYTILAGDEASYSTGTTNPGAPGSADSFPGTRPENAGTSTRNNFGGYAGLGWDISPKFLIDATARVERYSDFGNAFVWKLSSRVKPTDKLTVRGSASTGFRAPTLHQINLQISQASFVPGQGIQVKGIFNNRSLQAKVLGVDQLKAEKSVNFTGGLGYSPSSRFNFTLDYYLINVNDRIILGSEIDATGNANNALDKALTENGIVAISFFTNAINTSTSGLDVVANYRGMELAGGKLGLNVAGNYQIWNKLENAKSLSDYEAGDITKPNGDVTNPRLIEAAGKSVLDVTAEALMLTSRPKYKAILGFDWSKGKFGINLNNTLFGPTTFRNSGLEAGNDKVKDAQGNDVPDGSRYLKVAFLPKLVTDLGFNVELGKNTSLGLNINNLLNVLPEWELQALNAKGTAILANPAKVKAVSNAITFNQRYSNVTYDGSHFSQLGMMGTISLQVRF